MANIKSVSIQGEVPFYWLSDPQYGGGIPTDDAAFIAGLAMSPSGGLRIEYGNSTFVPNKDGSNGKTAMYEFELHGEEAISFPALERFVGIIGKVGVVEDIEVHDIEDGHDQWVWRR